MAGIRDPLYVAQANGVAENGSQKNDWKEEAAHQLVPPLSPNSRLINRPN